MTRGAQFRGIRGIRGIGQNPSQRARARAASVPQSAESAEKVTVRDGGKGSVRTFEQREIGPRTLWLIIGLVVGSLTTFAVAISAWLFVVAASINLLWLAIAVARDARERGTS